MPQQPHQRVRFTTRPRIHTAEQYSTTDIPFQSLEVCLIPALSYNFADRVSTDLAPTMAPLVTKSSYSQQPIFNPQGGIFHIKDIVQMSDKYLHRTSDLVTGCLMLGAKIGAITKTQACYFRLTFLPHLKLRSLYLHQGEPFIGPDGLAVTIDGVVFGGEEQMQAGRYTLDTVDQDGEYVEWLETLLYRGTSKNDCNYMRRGEGPPKRDNKGKATTEWLAFGETVYKPLHPAPGPAAAAAQAPAPPGNAGANVLQPPAPGLAAAAAAQAPPPPGNAGANMDANANMDADVNMDADTEASSITFAGDKSCASSSSSEDEDAPSHFQKQPFGPGITPLHLMPREDQTHDEFMMDMEQQARTTGLPVGTRINERGEVEQVAIFHEYGPSSTSTDG